MSTPSMWPRPLVTAILALFLSVFATQVSAACPKALAGKRYSSLIRFYDMEMNLTQTCVTTNILVVRNGLDTFPGTGYCTDTAGNVSAYKKESIIQRESSDACLQYFEGTSFDGTTGEPGGTYRGWNIVVDNGKVMYSVGTSSDGSVRFFDRLELQ